MTLTNRNLLDFEISLDRLLKQYPILNILLKARVQDYQKTISMRMASLQEKIRDLNNAYFVIEGDNIQFETPSKIMDGNGQPVQSMPKPKMLEGKILEDYNKEMDELLSKSFEINL